jgi:AraC-like DNA-binding protein
MNVKKMAQEYANLNKLALKFDLGSFRSELLGWGFIDQTKWWRNYMHVHTYYEVCYAFAGRGTFEMLGKVYPVQAGDVFVAKPREEHEIISSQKDPLGIYFWSYTLVPAAATPSASDDPVDRLLHAFVESKSWVSQRVPGMRRTLELLSEEATRAEPGFLGIIEGLAAKLLLDTARAVVPARLPAEVALPRADGSARVPIVQAMRYIRDNHSRQLSIHDVAAQVCLSERHFTRQFKQHTGKSPLDFLTEVRVEFASQLLLDRSLAIKDIAAHVGYPDVRYFTTVFRRATGVTPAVYREGNGTKWTKAEHINNNPGRDTRRKTVRKLS